jgi:hypothetical protein
LARAQALLSAEPLLPELLAVPESTKATNKPERRAAERKAKKEQHQGSKGVSAEAETAQSQDKASAGVGSAPGLALQSPNPENDNHEDKGSSSKQQADNGAVLGVAMAGLALAASTEVDSTEQSLKSTTQPEPAQTTDLDPVPLNAVKKR